MENFDSKKMRPKPDRKLQNDSKVNVKGETASGHIPEEECYSQCEFRTLHRNAWVQWNFQALKALQCKVYIDT